MLGELTGSSTVSWTNSESGYHLNLCAVSSSVQLCDAIDMRIYIKYIVKIHGFNYT